MPALVTNSKIWGEMFGTKEMHLLFSDEVTTQLYLDCLLYTSPSPRDATLSRMPSSA